VLWSWPCHGLALCCGHGHVMVVLCLLVHCVVVMSLWSLLRHGVALVSCCGVVESCLLLAKWVGTKGEVTHLGVIIKKQ
jgi:hypothetical protein